MLNTVQWTQPTVSEILMGIGLNPTALKHKYSICSQSKNVTLQQV